VSALPIHMKVLISGAGMAGSSLAFWLAKLGHEVTVIERFPDLRATGLQIDLRGHGISVLKRMGLSDIYRSMAVPEQGLQVVDRSGRRRAFFPANTSGKGLQSFTTDWEIMRGDLCHLLHDAAVKHGAKYVFGSMVEGFQEKEVEGLEVNFKDGKKEVFDLLVGADGVHSRTRTMMLPGAPDAFYPIGASRGSGTIIAYCTIPCPIQEGEEYIATMFMAPGRRGVMTRRNNADSIQAYLGYTTNLAGIDRMNSARGDITKQKSVLTETLRGAGWRMEELLKSLGDATDFYCEHLGLVKLEKWSRGRVVLLGDAAYCPSVNTGMGTTSALVGAYILAGEIGRVDKGAEGLEGSLQAYENKFRPFMDQVQKGVDESGSEMPSSAFSIGVLNILMGVASFFKVDIGSWMIKEKVKNWDLPEYKDMV